VLFVITKSNWGGAQRYVYDLATNLPKNTFEVAVALGGSGELTSMLGSAGVRTISIEHLERDIHFFNEFRVFRTLLALYNKEQPDVVHLNSTKIGGLGSFAGRIAKVQRIIFTVHGWAFNEERNSLFRLALWFFSWLTIIFCHKVITISYHDTRQAVSFPFVSSNKTTVLI